VQGGALPAGGRAGLALSKIKIMIEPGAFTSHWTLRYITLVNLFKLRMKVFGRPMIHSGFDQNYEQVAPRKALGEGMRELKLSKRTQWA
jgi:hypothetical protein